MKKYEFTVILGATEDVAKKGLETVTSVFNDAQVEILKQTDMGVRSLAYTIKKQDKGHYHYFEINANPETIVTFEKKFLLDNSILKFLFVVEK